MAVFTSDRQYYGIIRLIHRSKLSKYLSKKVHSLCRAEYGLARIVKDFHDGKVKIEVYYFDVMCAYAGANHIGSDIVEKRDLEILDWNMVKRMHASGNKYIVQDYCLNIELFNRSNTSFGGFREDGTRDRRVAVYRWPDAFDESKALVIFDEDDWFKYAELEAKWMIEQIESGKVDLEKHIKQLNAKYYPEIR